MKTDKYIKDVTRRLDNVISNGNDGNGSGHDHGDSYGDGDDYHK